jgi:hypothetical protein
MNKYAPIEIGAYLYEQVCLLINRRISEVCTQLIFDQDPAGRVSFDRWDEFNLHPQLPIFIEKEVALVISPRCSIQG